jgi:glutamine synthetase adenylyltransferase
MRFLKSADRAQSELRPRYGAPETLDPQGRKTPARFAVVSLGKLGGNELNYSSDIDLLFLFAGDGETSGPERLANNEYFVRLAQRLLQIISGVTREGPVFRVDMRLRPGGGEGDLAISLPAALDYYQRRAREWELQMLLKARASAGDAALVRELLHGVEGFLYRGAMHFAAVEAVVQAREGFARQLDAAAGDRLNVKLAPGGIRDIEFLVQCLQRLHGRDDPGCAAARSSGCRNFMRRVPGRPRPPQPGRGLSVSADGRTPPAARAGPADTHIAREPAGAPSPGAALRRARRLKQQPGRSVDEVARGALAPCPHHL